MFSNLESKEPLVKNKTMEVNIECPKKEVFCYDCNENVYINLNVEEDE